MPFLTQAETNWKFIAIVVVLAVIIGGGILFWTKTQEAPFGELPETEKPEKMDINKYLHKDAILEEGITLMMKEAGYTGISTEEAVVYAIQHLKAKDVKNIEIYESHWIVAPLSGYLIDGRGSFIIEDKYYATFRIGIRDGAEGRAGDEFVFIARGEDESGNFIWHPEPGPDFYPAQEELFAYEFLSDRENFETLSSRFIKEEETVDKVKVSDDEAKAIFQATEIVNNSLPDSIEFWTEAYCPGSGTKYDYRFFDIKMYEYVFDSCVEGDFGIHGGCETCKMSKIKLKKSPGDIKHVAIQSMPFLCGEKKLLKEEKTDWSNYSSYETFFEISDRVKVKMNERAWDSGRSSAVDYFTVLDNDKEISGYGVSFFSDPATIDILSYNNKKYFLIYGGEYGNKGGTSRFFLYVIKEDERVEPVRNSWGGNFNWSCDKFYEFCSLDYAFGYKNNLYLVIGGNVWIFGEDDIFKDRIYASAATFKDNELSFIVSRTKESPIYLGTCSVNIEDSGVPHEIKLPENSEKLNYGELIADEELCKKISGFWTIFGNYCLFQEACREKGVVPNSPADKAGILSGDIILEINGNKLIKNKIDEILYRHKPGEELTLKVLKDGKINLIPVKLGIKPEDLEPSFNTPTNIINSIEDRETYETCDIRGMACLAKGTKVTMSDNSYKNIEDIKKGDFVKSFDMEVRKINNSEVIEVIERTDPIVNINNKLKAAPDHPIYLADGSIRQASELKVGDLLFNNITVDFVDYSPVNVDTYDLILKDAVNFFAEGYLVGTPY